MANFGRTVFEPVPGQNSKHIHSPIMSWEEGGGGRGGACRGHRSVNEENPRSRETGLREKLPVSESWMEYSRYVGTGCIPIMGSEAFRPRAKGQPASRTPRGKTVNFVSLSHDVIINAVTNHSHHHHRISPSYSPHSKLRIQSISNIITIPIPLTLT